MATNKRKDAAALFELIDKSTLKVPKSASSLKIPGWWTSKSNPQTVAETAKNAPAAAPANVQPQVRVTPGAVTVPPAAAALPEANGQSAVHSGNSSSSQSRLFEPPAAAAGPVAAPSIRPPGASVRPPVSPTVKAPAAGAVKPAVADVGEVSVAPPAAAAALLPPGIPPTAPRNSWSPPKPGAFARMPTWVLVSMISGLILVACLIGLLLQNRHRPSLAQQGTAASGSTEGTQQPVIPPTPSPHSLIPEMNGGSSDTTHLAAANPGPVTGDANPQAPQPPRTDGRFTGPGTVDRNTDLMLQRNGGHEQYYIIIASSPSEDVAQRNGEFLAGHGIDVSMETQIIEKKKWYVLVTDDGFASYEAAEPFRKKIVQVGHELPAYKKTRDGRQAYDSARISNNIKTAAQSKAGG